MLAILFVPSVVRWAPFYPLPQLIHKAVLTDVEGPFHAVADHRTISPHPADPGHFMVFETFAPLIREFTATDITDNGFDLIDIAAYTASFFHWVALSIGIASFNFGF